MEIEEKTYSTKEFKADIKEVVWENRIQTVAVLLFFFFGVSTIMDLKKKK